jgi:type VI secretion system protein ImpG
MDNRLLQHYNRELQYMRELSGEFARMYPKIAGRLALDEFACADPYVERLLEGFAFLTARIHLKLDAEFPRLTQALLETVYPHCLAPTPSMLIAQLRPDPAQAATLVKGLTLPRETALRGKIAPGERTACEYRTGRPLTLWPIEIAQAAYHTRDLSLLEIPSDLSARACLRLRLRTQGDIPLRQLPLDRLPVFLRGTDEIPYRLYEQIVGHGSRLILQSVRSPRDWRSVLPREAVQPAGFDEDEALLPRLARSFQGYRYLHEYFAFPQRFLFVEFQRLAAGVRSCEDTELDLIVVLDQADPEMENRMDRSNFALHCVPAVNLFPKRADRIELTGKSPEYHVVPDRTRPLDFEVYQVNRVTGHGLRSDEEQPFRPFYGSGVASDAAARDSAFFSVNREPRMTSERETRFGRRTSYAGSEVFVSLSDARHPPYSADLRQLSVSTLCTNRDLPLQMTLGRPDGDFTLETSAPVAAVSCVAGPTPPRPSAAQGETAWRLVSHLSLNYLSLADREAGQGAAALRDILGLYAPASDPGARRQIDGLKSVVSQPVVRRVLLQRQPVFLRGLEVTVEFEDAAFQGAGAVLLGAVLERFFARYVSINTFTETAIRTTDRGEIMRWPIRTGNLRTL